MATSLTCDISLCVITRDEELTLGACLSSAVGAVDEVIVVDTGSTDGTVEVARRAGARVLSQPWTGDFAAARNASIGEARGGWILVLDADERLAPGAVAGVREAVRSPQGVAGMLRLHDASRIDASPAEVLRGGARLGEPVELPRLLRRTPDLAYEGVVHEHVNGWLSRHGRSGFRVEADIIHLGAAPEVRAARRKAARNIELLRRRCAQDPTDHDAAGYLALELYAEYAYEEAWSVVEPRWLRREQGSRFATRRLSIARGVLLASALRAEELLVTVAFERSRSPGCPELDYLEGCGLEIQAMRAPPSSAERAAHLQRAICAYTTALRSDEGRFRDHLLYGACSWVALTRTGHALLLLGDATGAKAAFTRARCANGDHVDAELGLAEAAVALGQPEVALARVEPLLGRARDAWWIAALAADAVSSGADAELFLRRARCDDRPFLAWHRAEALRERAHRAGPG